ncbi:hypothetical protein PFISCL1PPCAC_18039, partial [Pristionchus fissidentatus]
LQVKVDGTTESNELIELTRRWRLEYARTHNVEETICTIRQVVTHPKMIRDDLLLKGTVSWNSAHASDVEAGVLYAAQKILGSQTMDGIVACDDESRVAALLVHSMNKVSGNKRSRRDRLSHFLCQFPDGTTSDDALRSISTSGLTQPTLFRIGTADFCLSLNGRQVRLSSKFIGAAFYSVCYHYFFHV